MKNVPKLVINQDSHFYFTENPDLVTFLNERYPVLNFTPTLSVRDFPHNLDKHELKTFHVKFTDFTYSQAIQNDYIQSTLLNGFLDLLDMVVEDMHRTGIKTAAVHAISLHIDEVVDAIQQKRKLIAYFYGVFLRE